MIRKNYLSALLLLSTSALLLSCKQPTDAKLVLQLNPPAATIDMTQRYNLHLVKSSALGEVEFSSSDPDIATVTMSGSMLTVEPIEGRTGETTITVSADGMMSQSTITTIDLVKGVTFTDRRTGHVYNMGESVSYDVNSPPRVGDVWYYDIHNIPEGSKLELSLGFYPDPNNIKTEVSADQKVASISFIGKASANSALLTLTRGESTRTSMLGHWWNLL